MRKTVNIAIKRLDLWSTSDKSLILLTGSWNSNINANTELCEMETRPRPVFFTLYMEIIHSVLLNLFPFMRPSLAVHVICLFIEKNPSSDFEIDICTLWNGNTAETSILHTVHGNYSLGFAQFVFLHATKPCCTCNLFIYCEKSKFRHIEIDIRSKVNKVKCTPFQWMLCVFSVNVFSMYSFLIICFVCWLVSMSLFDRFKILKNEMKYWKKIEDRKKRQLQFVRKMHQDLFIASSRWQIKPVNEQVFTHIKLTGSFSFVQVKISGK